MSPKQKTTYNETKTSSQKQQKQQNEEQKALTPQKHKENPENSENPEKEAVQLEKMNLQIDKACFHIDKAVKIINETFLQGEQLLKNSQRQKTNQNLQITMSQCKICFEFLVNSISILNDLNSLLKQDYKNVSDSHKTVLYNSMNQFLQNCSSGLSQNQLENYFDSVSSDKFKEKATPPSDPYQNPIEQQISVQPFQTDLQSQKQNISNKENEVQKPVAQVFSSINIVQDGKKGKTVEKNFYYTFDNLIDQQTQVKINLTVVNDEVISQKKGNEYQKYPTYFKVDKISEYFLLNKSYQEFTKNEEFCDKTLNRWVIKGVQKNKGAGRKPLEWEKEQLSVILQYYKCLKFQKIIQRKYVKQDTTDLFLQVKKDSKGWYDRFQNRTQITHKMEQTILGLYPNATKRELIAKNYKGDIKQFNRFINDQQTNIDFKKVMEIYDVKEINFTQDEKNIQNDEYFIKYTFTRGKQQLIKFLSHELQETQNQNQQNNMEIEQIPQINKISPQQDQTISSNNISPEKTQTDETKYTETINETQQSFNSEEHTAESQENKILQKRQAILDLITIYIFDYVQNPQISHDQKHYHGVKLMALLETYLKIFKQELNPNSYQNQPINKSEQILDKSIQLNCEINSQECLYQEEINQEQNQNYCQSQIISDSLKNKNQINQEQQNSILQLLYGYGQDKEIQGEVTNSRQIQNYIKQTQIEQLEQRFNKIKEQIKLLPIQETNQLPQQQQQCQQQQQPIKQLNIFLNAESYNDCQNWIAINYQFKKIMNISGRVLGLQFSDNQQDNQKNYNNTNFDKNDNQYPEERKDENQENNQKQVQKANKAVKNLDQKGIKLINKSKTIKKDKKNENKIIITDNKKTKQYNKQQKKLSDNSKNLDLLQNNLLFQQEEEVYQEDLDPILQKQIDL